jgi:hypothetical protein
MKNVTLEPDPKKPGTFVARCNETNKIVATGGRVDTYDLYPQPDGTLQGSFSFYGFREVGPEEKTAQWYTDRGYTLFFRFFGNPCILQQFRTLNLTMTVADQHLDFEDVRITSCASMQRIDDLNVELRNFVVELANGGSFQISKGVFMAPKQPGEELPI